MCLCNFYYSTIFSHVSTNIFSKISIFPNHQFSSKRFSPAWCRRTSKIFPRRKSFRNLLESHLSIRGNEMYSGRTNVFKARYDVKKIQRSDLMVLNLLGRVLLKIGQWTTILFLETKGCLQVQIRVCLTLIDLSTNC